MSGGNCGELLLSCYSRDVHQLSPELFTAAGVAGIAGGSCGRSCFPLPSRPGRSCFPLPSRPGRSCFLLPSRPGRSCFPLPSRAGRSCFPLPSRAGRSCFPLPSRPPASRNRDPSPSPGRVARPAGAVRRRTRAEPPAPHAYRTTAARPPRACSPSRFAYYPARRGCSVSRLGFPPRSARARSSTTTTSLTPRAIPAALAAWHGLAPRQSTPPARISRRARRCGGSLRRGDRRNGAPGGVDWRKLTTRRPPQWWRLAQRQRNARSAQCAYIHRARRLDLGAGTNALTRAAARYISSHCASLCGELPQRQPPKD